MPRGSWSADVSLSLYMTINSSCPQWLLLKGTSYFSQTKKLSQQTQDLRPSNTALEFSCIFCFLSGKRTSLYWQDSTYFSRPAELVILLKQGPISSAATTPPTPDKSIARWQHFKCLIPSSYSFDQKYIQTQSPLTMTQLPSVLPFMCSIFCLPLQLTCFPSAIL